MIENNDSKEKLVAYLKANSFSISAAAADIGTTVAVLRRAIVKHDIDVRALKMAGNNGGTSSIIIDNNDLTDPFSNSSIRSEFLRVAGKVDISYQDVVAIKRKMKRSNCSAATAINSAIKRASIRAELIGYTYDDNNPLSKSSIMASHYDIAGTYDLDHGQIVSIRALAKRKGISTSEAVAQFILMRDGNRFKIKKHAHKAYAHHGYTKQQMQRVVATYRSFYGFRAARDGKEQAYKDTILKITAEAKAKAAV